MRIPNLEIFLFCQHTSTGGGNLELRQTIARIVFCHCEYEGCYVLNKIKVLIIYSSGRAIFFRSIFRAPLSPSLPRFEFGICEF
jgi:hypothetical protein